MKTIVVDVVQGLKFKVGEVTDGIVDKEERIEFAQHAHHTGDASVTAAVAINKQVISIANKVTGFKEDDKGVVPTTIAILSQGWDGTGPGPGTVLPECSLSLHSNSGPSKGSAPSRRPEGDAGNPQARSNLRNRGARQGDVVG